MDRLRTPSPPRRLRTPPAPKWGGDYEPYSPRRSSRVAAQQNNHLHLESTPTRTHARAARRDVTPTSSRKTLAPSSSSLTLSPPSSPVSPAKSSTRPQQPTIDAHPDTEDLDLDQIAAPTPARRFLSQQSSLLTPAKTPRKLALKPQESLGSTARVLFSNRPVTVEDAFPTPRKARKTTAYSLESFAEQMEEENSKIPIFTDSKERVPTLDDDEDNPFITKKGKGKAKAVPQKPRKQNSESQKLFEATRREEGVVFTFKGKKIFRKFHDGPPSNASEGEFVLHTEAETRHRAGAAAAGRITRSSIQPRLLFKEEIAQQKRERGEETDEEKATDNEPQVATPSRKAKSAVTVTATPLPQTATPPPTKRVTRQISFESWGRRKPSSRGDAAGKSKKRSGSPLESSTDKRARSEQSTPSVHSSMSVDTA
ncbi:hypothetical protein DM02DRAFT_675907 [Periconia macrospinosa]|uniref:Uncharacterized protein n=1 Tax=Periconia macrospinosa TaxID=97972 RepID=A0A2V1D9K2_9PLEO|nr:hypothetical protein DM02DRAFT_675907 [Periconia macrospinosa]